MNLNESDIYIFLKAAMGELQLITPTEGHHWKTSRIHRSENGYEIRPSTMPDFWAIISLEFSKHQSPSIRLFSENLERDSRLQHLQQATPAKWWDLEPEGVSKKLLWSYISRTQCLTYDGELAEKIAQNFLQSLETGYSDITFYCVVRGLTCDFEKYTSPNNVQLRKLADDEIARLIDRNPDVASEDYMPENCCLLEKQFALPISQLPLEINSASKRPEEIVADDFDAVITGLRLLKDGRVKRQFIYNRYDNPGQLTIPNLSGRTFCSVRTFAEIQSYELSKMQLPTLTKIIEVIKNGSFPTRLRTAVDRVNFVAERNRADDQLLDLLIAFEAIYGDSQGAIGYKIGLRCAVFIEENPEKRKAIRELINDAYERRSALVHGGQKRKGKTLRTTQQVNGELLALVRESLNRIIEMLIAEGKTPTGSDFDNMLT